MLWMIYKAKLPEGCLLGECRVVERRVRLRGVSEGGRRFVVTDRRAEMR